MSDISLPPEQAKAKKHFIDRLLPKFALTLMALAAPMPLLLVLINLWISGQAGQKDVNPFSVFRRIVEGGGDPPLWLLPIALILPVVLLTVLYRKSRKKLISVMIALVVAATAEAILFLQMTQ